MSKGVPYRNIVKIALGATILLAASFTVRTMERNSLSKLQEHTDNPAPDYESALERFDQLQAREANMPLNPVCYSVLLTHGKKMRRVIILMHGMLNCPQQYATLASLFYAQGYNVLIPLMPHSGLADRDTDALKFLTATELRDCSNAMVDIARGLGECVTYVGLSVGGSMAAWVAQNRVDVEKAVLIAPAFTFSSKLGIRASRFMMRLFCWLPNIMTQPLVSIKDAPFYNYYGFATRGLGQMMRLGFSVYDAAGTTRPAVQSILIITNAADPAVNNAVTYRLGERWLAHGLVRLETYEFAAKYRLIHDIVDPRQSRQQTAFVYPILLKLIADEGEASQQPG